MLFQVIMLYYITDIEHKGINGYSNHLSETEMTGITRYKEAVQMIKTAILQSRYRAARAANAEQLKLYFNIGRYVSANTRAGMGNWSY